MATKAKEPEFDTIDGAAPFTRAHPMKALYITNQKNSEFTAIKVEQKYGSSEMTGFIGCAYVKQGYVKQFQAKFLLNEVIMVPVTAVPILKAATVQRMVRDKDGKKTVKTFQRYVVSKED